MNDYTLAATRTQYVLQLIDLGADTKHVVAVEPLIQTDDGKPLIHHMLLHDCGNNSDALAFGGSQIPLDTPMNTGTFSPLGVNPCTNMIFGWAMGGGSVVFPQEAGVLIGSTAARYVVLELHVDNPNVMSGIKITTGIRLHTTTTLRANDIGTLVLGNPTVNFPLMAAGKARVHNEGTCSSTCTETFTGPLNLFLSFPHMHSYGKEIWSEITSQGGLKTIISSKQYWNFGFQNQIPISIVLNQSDSISTHCVYDTSKAASGVSFGTASNQEMCMDFVQYWPKSNFGGLKCGYDGGKTACGLSQASGVNPQPDGLKAVPQDLLVGSCHEPSDGEAGDPTKSPVGSAADRMAGSRLIVAACITMLVVFLGQ